MVSNAIVFIILVAIASKQSHLQGSIAVTSIQPSPYQLIYVYHLYSHIGLIKSVTAY